MQITDFVGVTSNEDYVPTLEELEMRLVAISNEAFSLTGAADLSKRFLENFKSYIKDSYNFISKKLEVFISNQRRIDDRELLKIVKAGNINYLQLSGVEIPSIAGLNTTFLEYAGILDQAANITGTLDKELIQQVNGLIGRFINYPEELSQASISDEFNYRTNSGELREQLAKCLSGDTTKSRLPFSSLYERMSDTTTLVNLVNSISEKHHKVGSKQMLKIVSDLGKQLEHLNRVTQKLDDNKLSSNIASMLSNVIFTAAKEVEFYSVVGFQLETLCKTTQSGFDELVTKLT